MDVPLTLQRLNGSAGRILLSVAGLPADVTATLLPKLVPGTVQNAVLRLSGGF